MENSGPPTLLDLMKARGVLSPAEAIQIATPLAKAVDSSPEGSLILTKQAVSILAGDDRSGDQTRGMLHRPLSEWPSFRVEAEKLSEAERRSLPLSSGKETSISGQTIVPGLNNSGGSIGALASLIYQMVGGTPTGRYVPVARLSENQNIILQRAIASGAILYTKAAELLAKLQTEALDNRVTPAPAPTPAGPAAPPPMAFPPSSLPQPIQNFFQPPSPNAPAADGFKGFLQTREGRQMALAGAGAVLLVMVIGIVVLFSGHSHGDTPKNGTQAQTPTSPVIQAPNNGTQTAPGGNDTPNSLADLVQRFKNNAGGNNNANPPQPANNGAAQSVRFNIAKQLTQGGLAEKIVLSITQNGRPVVPNQTLYVAQNPGYGSISVSVPGPGPYVISAMATSTTNYGAYSGRGFTAPIQVYNGETVRLSFDNVNQAFRTFNINFSN